MVRAFAEQTERGDYRVLGFEDRLGLIVDREAQDCDNGCLDRYPRVAKLRIGACVEDIDFRRSRGLERSVVLSLAEAEWVGGHRNVLIVGRPVWARPSSPARWRRLRSAVRTPRCTYGHRGF
jgi:hypothetical protein